MYRDFEMQKICYLPVAALILKPLQRVLHLHTLLTSQSVATSGVVRIREMLLFSVAGLRRC